MTTQKEIGNEILRLLENNLIFTKHSNRSFYDYEYNEKVNKNLIILAILFEQRRLNRAIPASKPTIKKVNKL